MAYNKEELINQCIEAINNNEIIFLEELISFLPCSSKTFYNYKLQDLQVIKEELENNKIRKKIEIRKKWSESENATLQIALYKLLANEEEYNRLTNRYFENSNQKYEAPQIILQVIENTN